jgi:hypothetical protein
MFYCSCDYNIITKPIEAFCGVLVKYSLVWLSHRRELRGKKVEHKNVA